MFCQGEFLFSNACMSQAFCCTVYSTSLDSVVSRVETAVFSFKRVETMVFSFNRIETAVFQERRDHGLLKSPCHSSVFPPTQDDESKDKQPRRDSAMFPGILVDISDSESRIKARCRSAGSLPSEREKAVVSL